MDVFLTLDYELFMGNKTGSVDNCLITPMDYLIESTGKYGVRFTVFVDAAYLFKLNELRSAYPSLDSDYKKIVTNLKRLSEMGHDIELHLHPQWYFSYYKNELWVLDKNHYKLSDLTESELDFYIPGSISLLEEIIEKKIIAFRAGGYSIQSLNNHSSFFRKNNIRIDSSVASGQKCLSEKQFYNYTGINDSLYHFSQDISVADKNGDLLELPISSRRMSPSAYLLYRIYLKYILSMDQPFGDGRPINNKNGSGVIEKILNSFVGPEKVFNCSMDYVWAPLFKKVINESVKNDTERVVFIGHPKSMSKKSIDILTESICKVKGFISFLTVSDIVRL